MNYYDHRLAKALFYMEYQHLQVPSRFLQEKQGFLAPADLLSEVCWSEKPVSAPDKSSAALHWSRNSPRWQKQIKRETSLTTGQIIMRRRHRATQRGLSHGSAGTGLPTQRGIAGGGEYPEHPGNDVLAKKSQIYSGDQEIRQ